MSQARKLWTLFFEMFKIATFVVGGGFAIIAVADEVFSRKLHWTEEGEVAGALPLFQMFPGIIAGNTAIYIGRKVAGLPGAMAALVGVFLPSVIIFSAVSAGYRMIPLDNALLEAAFLGLRAALTGIILAMIVRGWRKGIQGAYGWAALAAALSALMLLRMNPAIVIAAAICCGIAAKLSEPRKGVRTFQSPWMIPLIFAKYGLLAFGGGYVLVPMYVGDFVGEAAPYLQLSGSEFADVMALTQMTPGPIAVNCATFFGYRMGMDSFGAPAAALLCAFAATLALLIPGSTLLYIALGSIERFRESRIVQGILQGVRPVTIAMMMSALWTFAGMSVWAYADGTVSFSAVGALLASAAAILMLTRKLGVVRIIFACAAAAVAAKAFNY